MESKPDKNDRKRPFSDSEKLREIAHMIQSMEHEVVWPLKTLRSFASHLSKSNKRDDEQARRKFFIILEEKMEKMEKVIWELIDFARSFNNHIRKGKVHFSELMDDTIQFLQGSISDKKAEIVCAYSKQDLVELDLGRIKYVFLCILLSNLEKMEKGGSVTVSTITYDKYLEVVISATGQIIQKEQLLADLSPSLHNIIQDNGGSITIEHRPGQLAITKVRLLRS